MGRRPIRSALNGPMDNPRTFLDVEIDGEAAGKLVLTLYADVVPKTAENFRVLCTGEAGSGKRGKKLHFKYASSSAESCCETGSGLRPFWLLS